MSSWLRDKRSDKRPLPLIIISLLTSKCTSQSLQDSFRWLIEARFVNVALRLLYFTGYAIFKLFLPSWKEGGGAIILTMGLTPPAMTQYFLAMNLVVRIGMMQSLKVFTIACTNQNQAILKWNNSVWIEWRTL